MGGLSGGYVIQTRLCLLNNSVEELRCYDVTSRLEDNDIT